MEYFQKRGLPISHLNINSLPPKIDDICYIAKQSNASIIGIIETKLDSSILNSEVHIENYNFSRMSHLRRGSGVACYIRQSLSYSHKPYFCDDTVKAFL